MKISTKGRYAIRLLVDIAENQGTGYVALKDVANRQGISKKYLEQIAAVLNKPDILRTSHGYNGGYRLAKAPSKYTLGDILRITEGSLNLVSCLDGEYNECEKAGNCITLSIWKDLSDMINNYLDGITIQDLLDKQKETYSYDYII